MPLGNNELEGKGWKTGKLGLQPFPSQNSSGGYNIFNDITVWTGKPLK